MGGRLGDEQSIEAADDVGQRVPEGAPGDRAPHHLLQLQHLVATRPCQDVGRLGIRRGRDDGNVLGQGPHREDDVRVLVVGGGREDEGRPPHAEPLPGLGIVQLPEHDVEPRIVEPERLLKIGNHEHVAHPVLLEAADDGGRHRIVVREEHVALHVRSDSPRGAPGRLRLDPRPVEELDEREGQQHQKEEDAGRQHDHGEGPAEVAVERDVPEPERGHHGERPVEPREPRVVLSFPDHQRVEQDGIRQDHRNQRAHELGQDTQIALTAPGTERGVDRGEGLQHLAPPAGDPTS